MHRLTKKYIDAAGIPATGSTTLKDTEQGLTLRISFTGTRSWQFRGRIKSGKMISKSLGRYPAIKPEQARTLASKLTSQLYEQQNPVIEERKARKEAAIEEAQARTVGELVEEFLPLALRGLKRPDAKQAIYEGHIVRVWGDKQINELSAIDIIDGIESIRTERGEDPARKALIYLRELLTHLQATEVITRHPAIGLTPKKMKFTRTRRDRAAGRDEIALLLQAIDDAPKLDTRTRVGLRLQLMLGNRMGELLQADWSEVNFIKATWRVPAAHVKTGNSYTIPLPQQAIVMFQTLHGITAVSGKVMGGMDEKALSRALNRLQKPSKHKSPLLVLSEGLTVHDLRRSCATWLATMGNPPHILRAVLNHSHSGELATYDRSDLMQARRKALQDWADALENPAKLLPGDMLPAEMVM